MGCDGGTIPTRDELVRTKKKPEQKDKDSERLFQWQHCHLTQEQLRKPIVACQLGRLYNKEAVIERLLDKSSSTSNGNRTIDHIKGLKDIKELDLTTNPSYGRKKNPSVGDNYVDKLISPWICPITGLEMNGRFKFVFDWSNGKVLSERAYKMVKDDETSRILEENMVILNPSTEEEKDIMQTKMEARKARIKLEKKAKRKPQENGGESGSSSETKRAKASAKGEPTENGASSSAANSKTNLVKKSVQQDSSKSEVFKSLFSSHKSAQNKPKGHWVTFDPRYN